MLSYIKNRYRKESERTKKLKGKERKENIQGKY